MFASRMGQLLFSLILLLFPLSKASADDVKFVLYAVDVETGAQVPERVTLLGEPKNFNPDSDSLVEYSIPRHKMDGVLLFVKFNGASSGISSHWYQLKQIPYYKWDSDPKVILRISPRMGPTCSSLVEKYVSGGTDSIISQLSTAELVLESNSCKKSRRLILEKKFEYDREYHLKDVGVILVPINTRSD